MEFYSRKEFEEATRAVRAKTPQEPRIGIVLGSGLGEFAASVEGADVIPYGDIPHWPVSTVEGHSGQLYVGQLEGQPVMVMSGRTHYYEGYPMSQITLPVRVMQLMGVHTLIVTNAAGGITEGLAPGTLMFLSDHINLPGMAGNNPLRGPNDDALGERFPDMTMPYDPALRALARQAADDADVPAREGVYVAVAGPSFETPAEIRFLKTAGADAVGMSTVHETIVARHAGMRVLGISGITNVALAEATDDNLPTHEEVLEAGKVLVPRLEKVLRGVLRGLPSVQ
jgi:purine-nucleoside phosphorylase